MPTSKAEETSLRILDSALELFRSEGFDAASMRDIAQKAGVATGAAYYYYPSKEAIVLDFYRRSCVEMQPKIQVALEPLEDLEARLRELIRQKFIHFAPNRSVLRTLLRNGADPKHPLSPFSEQTKEIREVDINWFRQILSNCGVRIPRDIAGPLPEVLWFFQMGVIFFWVIDESPDQARSLALLDLSTKLVATLIRFSSLPFMKPLRKPALQLIELVRGGGNHGQA